MNTQNVTALTLDFPAGQCSARASCKPSESSSMDIRRAAQRSRRRDRSWRVHLSKIGDKWKLGRARAVDDATCEAPRPARPDRRRVHGLVRLRHAHRHGLESEAWASGSPASWSAPSTEWRRQFRGDAPQKKDTEVTDDDIAKNNLVLWGDPSSNAVLAKIADKLPIKWTADGIEVGGKKFAAGEHVPVLIYPNPLNPKRYVVLNSGFTYREYDYLNNARQVPKLPDWAIVNLSEPPNAVSPGKVVAADFFDEQWKLKPLK